MDWEAIRAEYAAGGISQRALARKHGVTVYALKRHALQGCRAPARRAGSDAEIALRTRRKLLAALERMTDELPPGAVTEYKTQDDSAVSLFKLRDLTAAYKELTGDLPLGGDDRDAVRIIVDP